MYLREITLQLTEEEYRALLAEHAELKRWTEERAAALGEQPVNLGGPESLAAVYLTNALHAERARRAVQLHPAQVA